MQFIWQELIDRARVYLDDDHDDQQWIEPAQILTLGNVELAQLYRRWVRMGLVSPAPQDQAFTGHTFTQAGVLVTVGLAEDQGEDRLRILAPAQSRYGRSPFWTRLTGSACFWSATNTGTTYTYSLDPKPTSGNYLVRYIPTLAYATDPTATVDLPDGGDERLVLGMARRAHIKDSGVSRQIENLISLQDAELTMTAFSSAQNDGPRVRIAKEAAMNAFPTDPARWYWR